MSFHPGWPKVFLYLFLLFLIQINASWAEDDGCKSCHDDKSHGQQAFHQLDCVSCHSGNSQLERKDEAHRGLIPYPGNLSNADQTCGQCHDNHVQAVQGHIMTSARGMVETTRHVLGDPDDGAGISELGDSISDSLLRKLCAGCHLGRDRELHTHTLTALNRGGGCLACHLDEYPQAGHVQLTKNISDARCFGCHSRSGRISLNYAGLAELDEKEAAGIANTAWLPDGRLVQIKESDIHHQAGMSCIDCHTGSGLMGTSTDHETTLYGVDIQCTDCHNAITDKTNGFNTKSRGSILSHLKQDQDKLILQLKNSEKELPVPVVSDDSHTHLEEHSRLSCDACHTQWAPLCYGCHVRFDDNEQQYDYLEKKLTDGKWKEERWNTQSGSPVLGVDANNQIRPFVPGMILTLEHPELDRPLFRRLFAPLSAHTIGKARTCQSCHCDSKALGLGSGTFTRTRDGWSFVPTMTNLEDGVPADAWHNQDELGEGLSTQTNARSLNAEEINRIMGTDVECR